jgi:hypothetical protein
LKKGDRLKFKIEGDKMMVQKLSYSNSEHLDSLSNLLPEWLSSEDEEA